MGPATAGRTPTHTSGATLRRRDASPTPTARRPYTAGEARGEGV